MKKSMRGIRGLLMTMEKDLIDLTNEKSEKSMEAEIRGDQLEFNLIEQQIGLLSDVKASLNVAMFRMIRAEDIFNNYLEAEKQNQ